MLSRVNICHCCNSSQCSKGRVALLGHDVGVVRMGHPLCSIHCQQSRVFLLLLGAAQLGLPLVLCGLHSVLNSEPRIRQLLATTSMQVRKMPAWCNAGFYFTSEWKFNVPWESVTEKFIWLSYEWWVLKNNVCATYFCGYFRKCITRGKQPTAQIMVKTKLKVELVQYDQRFFILF